MLSLPESLVLVQLVIWKKLHQPELLQWPPVARRLYCYQLQLNYFDSDLHRPGRSFRRACRWHLEPTSTRTPIACPCISFNIPMLSLPESLVLVQLVIWKKLHQPELLQWPPVARRLYCYQLQLNYFDSDLHRPGRSFRRACRWHLEPTSTRTPIACP
ncbi:hypothetical protein AHF37_09366 [Paragonimus kellicotti]|nr:hypothetical protein AHF37_09366 [Paragonimus kellicotti]